MIFVSNITHLKPRKKQKDRHSDKPKLVEHGVAEKTCKGTGNAEIEAKMLKRSEYEKQKENENSSEKEEKNEMKMVWKYREKWKSKLN